MKSIRLRILAIGLGLLCLHSGAQAENRAVLFSAGTGGLGLGLGLPLTETLSGRIGANYFEYDDTLRYSGVDYDADLRWRSAHLMLDWYPAGEGFRFSAGVFYNGNRVKGHAEPEDGAFDVGDGLYAVGQIDRIRGEVDFRPLAPYLGVGYSRGFGAKGRLGLTVDLGVVFQGKPRVDLDADGPAATDPGFQADLASEERSIEGRLDSAQYYPWLSVGLRLGF